MMPGHEIYYFPRLGGLKENVNIYSAGVEGMCSTYTNMAFDEFGSWTGALGFAKYTSSEIVAGKAIIYCDKFYESDASGQEELCFIDNTTCDMYRNTDFTSPAGTAFSDNQLTWPSQGTAWVTGKSVKSCVHADEAIFVNGDGDNIRHPLGDTNLYRVGIRVVEDDLYDSDQITDGVDGTVTATDTIQLPAAAGNKTGTYRRGLPLVIRNSNNDNNGTYTIDSVSWDGTNTSVEVEDTPLTTGDDTGDIYATMGLFASNSGTGNTPDDSELTVDTTYWYTSSYVNDRGFASNYTTPISITLPNYILNYDGYIGNGDFEVGNKVIGYTTGTTAVVTHVHEVAENVNGWIGFDSINVPLKPGTYVLNWDFPTANFDPADGFEVGDEIVGAQSGASATVVYSHEITAGSTGWVRFDTQTIPNGAFIDGENILVNGVALATANGGSHYIRHILRWDSHVAEISYNDTVVGGTDGASGVVIANIELGTPLIGVLAFTSIDGDYKDGEDLEVSGKKAEANGTQVSDRVAFLNNETLRVSGSSIALSNGSETQEVQVAIEGVTDSTEDSCNVTSSDYDIDSITDDNIIVLDSAHGDVSAEFIAGGEIVVDESDKNDGTYTIVSAAYSASKTRITIKPADLVSGGTDEGTAYALPRSKKYIYRGTSEDGPFYFLKEIDYDATTATDDGTTELDEDILGYADEHDPPADGQQHVCYHNGCLWMALDDKIIFSSAGDDMEAFPPLNYIYAGFEGGGKVNGLVPFGNAVLVIGERAVKKLIGNTVDTVQLQEIVGVPGCKAIHSVFQGEGFIGWYAGEENGIIGYDGNKVYYLTKHTIDDTVKGLNNPEDIVCLYANRKLYASHCAEMPAKTLILDLSHSNITSNIFNWYVLTYNNVDSPIRRGFKYLYTWDGDGDNNEVFGCSPYDSCALDTSCRIYQLEKPDTYTNDTTQFRRTVQTIPIECEYPYHEKYFHGAILDFTSTPTEANKQMKVTVTPIVDGTSGSGVDYDWEDDLGYPGYASERYTKYFSFMNTTQQLLTGRDIALKIEIEHSATGSDDFDKNPTIGRVGIHIKPIPFRQP